MDISDPNTWTKEFVVSHWAECIRFLQDTNKLVIHYIRQRNYPAAITGLDRILNGLILMQNSGHGDFHSHISMFSMVEGTVIACCMEAPEDRLRKTAAALFADARDFAKTDKAKQKMEALRSELESGVPLSQWRKAYDEEETIGFLQDLNEQLEKECSVSAPSAPNVQKTFDTSSFDGKTLQLIGRSILAFLLTGITFGLAYPWAFCMLERWRAKHTEINGRRLKFNGHGSQLFGRYILWVILTIITFGIYGIWFGLGLKKWIVKHTVYADDTPEFESRFTGKAGDWFIQHLLAGLISVVTLGIGAPWATKRLMCWEAEHTVIGGSPLVFEGTGGQLFVNYLLAGIFTVLTLGLYALYFPIKLLKWQYSHTKALYRTEKIRALSREHETAANKDFAKYSLAANDTELRIFKSGMDGTESEERLEELANSGNPYAQYQLAVKLKGESDRFDGRALELLEASAAAKYYKALLSYAVQNKDKEEQYSQLLEDAAKGGSSEASWLLAEHYQKKGYAKDGGKSAESLSLFKQAAYWFKVAIEQEYPMAMASRMDYAVLIDRIALLEAGQNPQANCTKKNKAKSVVTTVVAGAVVILSVCMIIFMVCAVSIVDHVGRSFFGYKAFVAMSDSMKATDFAAGDLVISKAVDPSTLQVGDVITFQSTDKEIYGEIVTHKIRELTTDAEGNPGFITYGTTADINDENIVTYNFVIGKYQTKLSDVGNFVVFLRRIFFFLPASNSHANGNFVYVDKPNHSTETTGGDETGDSASEQQIYDVDFAKAFLNGEWSRGTVCHYEDGFSLEFFYGYQFENGNINSTTMELRPSDNGRCYYNGRSYEVTGGAGRYGYFDIEQLEPTTYRLNITFPENIQDREAIYTKTLVIDPANEDCITLIGEDGQEETYLRGDYWTSDDTFNTAVVDRLLAGQLP